VAEVKASESNVGFKFDLEPKKGRKIIDTKPNATTATTNIQPNEPNEPEEGKCLFHS
jgi:hypothetical protein